MFVKSLTTVMFPSIFFLQNLYFYLFRAALSSLLLELRKVRCSISEGWNISHENLPGQNTLAYFLGVSVPKKIFYKLDTLSSTQWHHLQLRTSPVVKVTNFFTVVIYEFPL
jgi:hypothetical protein